MELSVIIPVYNEEDNIPVLFGRLRDVLQGMNLSWEMVFVNDGSADKSLQVLKQLAEEHPEVRYIDFSRNFGHQIAVSAGLDHVRGKAIVIIDADLQDPPELIPQLYARMKEGYEVVYARRRSRKGESWLKLWTARIFYRLMARLTSVNIPLDTGDFRIMDRKIVDILRAMPEHHKFLRGQISWIGFDQTYVEYDRDERLSGKTGYSYAKMVNFALDGITGFSNFPIKLATYLGFLFSGISFLIIIYALISKFLLDDYQPGWASTIIAVTLIGGVQLICLGIIGEYISRINSNVRQRPLYIVRETNAAAEHPSNKTTSS